MAKVTIIVEDCTTKISPDCTGTFERKAQRGRPAKSCMPCREFAKMGNVVKKTSAEKAVFIADRTCPCGNTYQVKPGRGRKAEKCEDCRNAGTVYRTNDEGTIEAIRAETLVEEQREKAEQAGKERASRLCDMMAPLLLKRNRVVITR